MSFADNLWSLIQLIRYFSLRESTAYFLTNEMVFFKNNDLTPEPKDLVANPLSPCDGLMGASDLTFQEQNFWFPLTPYIIFISLPGSHCSLSCSGCKQWSQPWFSPSHMSSGLANPLGSTLRTYSKYDLFKNKKQKPHITTILVVIAKWYFCLNDLSSLQTAMPASDLTPRGLFFIVTNDLFKASVRSCHFPV